MARRPRQQELHKEEVQQLRALLEHANPRIEDDKARHTDVQSGELSSYRTVLADVREAVAGLFALEGHLQGTRLSSVFPMGQIENHMPCLILLPLR